MNFTMTKPCDNCPFLREGGIRLNAQRVRQIAGMMLDSQGGTFPCHKTTTNDDDGEAMEAENSQHCAGALIFAEKNGNATQMMRISQRLKLYDHARLMSDESVVALVFDDLEEMLDANQQRTVKKRKRVKR